MYLILNIWRLVAFLKTTRVGLIQIDSYYSRVQNIYKELIWKLYSQNIGWIFRYFSLQ